MFMRSMRKSMRMSCATGALLATAALLPATAIISTAEAQTATPLPPVTVEKQKVKAKVKPKPPARSQQAPAAGEEAALAGKKGLSKPLTSTTVSGEAIASKAPATSDTASLLRDVPGVSTYTGGGVSSLPVIQGLADDRLKITLNGMILSAACANHMNPPLSYIDPGQVKKIDVYAGVTPVSVGGDSIGGTIAVESLTPQFAGPDEGVVTHGSLSGFVRSNGNGIGGSASASAATNNLSIAYTGAWSRADDYEDGSGRKVGSTEYEAQNHALALAARKNGDLYVLEAGIQHIPYQGFVNQAMDMTLNNAWYINGRYEGNFAWGKLDVRGFYHQTRHKMNFLDDKVNAFAAAGWGDGASMPMDTRGIDAGYSVKGEIPLSSRDVLRVGNEFHHEALDDWWPPMMMGQLTYWNINGGTRDRLGTFAEWERKWTPQWTSLIGVRNDVVWMSTGQVQPYMWMAPGMDPDSDAAYAFNAKSHGRTDVNLDLTALVRYEPDAMHSFEAGYARKTRSPNLDERYAWGEGAMSSQMISWFGDVNGYVGNLDLDPEVAHKLSFTVGWHDQARKVWDLKLTPYYSFVQDYITAEVVPPLGYDYGFNKLKFVNHNAELYGIDISGRVNLGDVSSLGRFALTGVVGYVHGEDLESDNPLYHMMPWNARFAVEQKLGNWTNAVELQLVDDKTRIDQARLEPATPGYALVNLRTSYQWERLRLDLGVENVFDKLYFPPLGGTNYTDYLMPGNPVAGMGRSFYAGVTMKF